MNNPMNWENLAKRLLVLMGRGVYLTSDSGHIWFEYDDTEDHYFANLFRNKGLSLNSKVYGGVLEALNIIDKALEAIGEPPLIEQWDADWMFLGEDSYRPCRFNFVKPGGIE